MNTPPRSAPAPPPRVLFWETTVACNLRCGHCRRGSARRTAAPEELSTEEATEFLTGLAAWAKPLIVMSGGEPLTRPDLVTLAARASGLGLPVAVATNGTLLDAASAGALKRAGVRRVSVSLDGAGPPVHDRARGVPGSFDAALRGLRTLRAAGLGAQINTTLSRSTRGELRGVFELAEREGVDALHLFLFVPVGCGLELGEGEALAAPERDELMREARSLAAAAPFEVRLTCSPGYGRILAEAGGGEAARHSSGCLAGRGICFVSHAGEVGPCGYLPLSAGNLRVRGLREIWESAPLFLSLRDRGRLFPPCGTCVWREACGGCRARAFSETGDHLAGERACPGHRRREGDDA